MPAIKRHEKRSEPPWSDKQRRNALLLNRYFKPWETDEITEPVRFHDGMILTDPAYIAPTVFNDREEASVEWWAKRVEQFKPKRPKKKKPKPAARKKPEAPPPPRPALVPYLFRVTVTAPPAPPPPPPRSAAQEDIDGLTLKGLSLANARVVADRLEYSAAGVAVILLQPGKAADPEGGAVIQVFTCGSVSDAQRYVENCIKLNQPRGPFDALIFDRETLGAFRPYWRRPISLNDSLNEVFEKIFFPHVKD